MQVVSPNMEDTVIRSVVMPNSLENELSKLNIADNDVNLYKFGSAHLATTFEKSRLMRVSEYYDTGVIDNKDGTFTARYISHPIFYPAIVHNNHIFIFSPFDTVLNSRIFARYLDELDVRVQNSEEALELVKFFFLATHARGGRRIVSGVDDIDPIFQKNKETNIGKLRDIVVPPKATAYERGWEVEFYTWNAINGQVEKWKVSVQECGITATENKGIGRI